MVEFTQGGRGEPLPYNLQIEILQNSDPLATATHLRGLAFVHLKHLPAGHEQSAEQLKEFGEHAPEKLFKQKRVVRSISLPIITSFFFCQSCAVF